MNKQQKARLEQFTNQLRYYLVDPDTEIKLGKCLSLKNGGGIIISLWGINYMDAGYINRKFNYHDVAFFDFTLAYTHSIAPKRIIHLNGPTLSVMIRAAICEYRHYRHGHRLKRGQEYDYQAVKQQVFPLLRKSDAARAAPDTGHTPPPADADGFPSTNEKPPHNPPPTNDNAAPLTPEQAAILREITEIAAMMDAKFLGLFGVDALLDLPFLNFIGAPAAALPSLWIVLRAKMLGLPSDKLVRMLANIGLDTGIGLIPVPGVNMVADALYKANLKNLNIVLDHFGQPPYKRR
jgi:hypothetical protein